jgi:glycosyltransferase involved in cell wall biosynthesis
MADNRSILIFGSEPWSSPLLSKQHVAIALSASHRVTWVEPPFHLGYLLRGRTPSSLKFPPFHDIRPRGMARIRVIEFPRSHAWSRAKRWSIAALRIRLKLANIDPDLAITFHPGYWSLGRDLGVPLVYYSVDHQLDQQAEAHMLARADLVVAGTRLLFERYEGRTRALVYLPHGVDFSSFGPATPAPPELRDLPRPMAGFIGAIDDRLDLDALSAASRAAGSGSIVLVGPSTPGDFGSGLPRRHADRLEQLTNVHLVGRRRTSELGTYLAAFDAGLIPYDRTHPRVHFSLHKVLQYMAFGKPVVTTLEPDNEHQDLPGMFAATSPEGFSDALAAALADPPDPVVLGSFASTQSWGCRVDELMAHVAALHP